MSPTIKYSLIPYGLINLPIHQSFQKGWDFPAIDIQKKSIHNSSRSNHEQAMLTLKWAVVILYFK